MANSIACHRCGSGIDIHVQTASTLATCPACQALILLPRGESSSANATRSDTAERSTKNPYEIMLGLPQNSVDPNHYELLSLQPFANDRKTIQTAAVNQNRKLLQWQNPSNKQYYEVAGRLMDQIADVRDILLDPQRKQAYDRSLRDQLGIAEAAPTPTEVTAQETKHTHDPPLTARQGIADPPPTATRKRPVETQTNDRLLRARQGVAEPPPKPAARPEPVETNNRAYLSMLKQLTGQTEPNHYELLGLERFTGTEATIRDRMQERTLLLLDWLDSEHAATADHLGNEIVAAGNVLLDPAKRKKYDASLRGLATSPATLGLAPIDDTPEPQRNPGLLGGWSEADTQPSSPDTASAYEMAGESVDMEDDLIDLSDDPEVDTAAEDDDVQSRVNALRPLYQDQSPAQNQVRVAGFDLNEDRVEKFAGKAQALSAEQNWKADLPEVKPDYELSGRLPAAALVTLVTVGIPAGAVASQIAFALSALLVWCCWWLTKLCYGWTESCILLWVLVAGAGLLLLCAGMLVIMAHSASASSCVCYVGKLANCRNVNAVRTCTFIAALLPLVGLMVTDYFSDWGWWRAVIGLGYFLGATVAATMSSENTKDWRFCEPCDQFMDKKALPELGLGMMKAFAATVNQCDFHQAVRVLRYAMRSNHPSVGTPFLYKCSQCGTGYLESAVMFNATYKGSEDTEVTHMSAWPVLFAPVTSRESNQFEIFVKE